MYLAIQKLLLPRRDSLFYTLGGAWLWLHLDKGSLYGLVGYDNIVELILGDDVDGIGVCGVLELTHYGASEAYKCQ